MHLTLVLKRIISAHKTLTISLLCFLFLFACASTKSNRPSPVKPLTIADTTLCKTVKSKDDLTVPVKVTREFTTEDKEVFSHVTFINLTGKHHIRWEWRDPDGNLFDTTGNFPLKVDKDKYVREGTLRHRLKLKDSQAVNHLGEWRVGIYKDEELVAVDKFFLKKVISPAEIAAIDFGKYHALVIGDNNYPHLPKLHCAQKDAQDVAVLLKEKYGFEVDLKLNATRAEILTALDRLRRELGEDDNLLIYYAGHGSLDRPADEGYWLPVDATEDSQVNWIASSQITTNVKAIRAKHVLVVADSCYAGKILRAGPVRGLDIKKTQGEYQNMVSSRVRSVITSGGEEPVMDTGGKNGHSVFAAAFIDVLKDNEDIIDGLALFHQLRDKVKLNADQQPDYADMRWAGHESGDFVFVRSHLVKEKQ
jgi:hypothetical protein